MGPRAFKRRAALGQQERCDGAQKAAAWGPKGGPMGPKKGPIDGNPLIFIDGNPSIFIDGVQQQRISMDFQFFEIQFFETTMKKQ